MKNRKIIKGVRFDMPSLVKRSWSQWLSCGLFVLLAAIATTGPVYVKQLSDPRWVPALNVALSIGTSGVVAYIFYYVVTRGTERRRRELVKSGAIRAYKNAKSNIALAIIHASQLGGRTELKADNETIDKVLTVEGFKELFLEGSEADQGFYAFQNQMHQRTPQFDEIMLNLSTMVRIFERLSHPDYVDDDETYNFFVRLDSYFRRIERNGPGYDESKLLSSLMWTMFGGWCDIRGEIGYDEIESAIKKL